MSILKDTHVKVYYCYSEIRLEQEYDVTMPVWEAFVIVILGLLPVANISLFTVFIIYYAIHAGLDPNICIGYTHVFSLRGNNIVIRGLLKVKNLLCKRI